MEAPLHTCPKCGEQLVVRCWYVGFDDYLILPNGSMGEEIVGSGEFAYDLPFEPLCPS